MKPGQEILRCLENDNLVDALYSALSMLERAKVIDGGVLEECREELNAIDEEENA